MRVDRDTPICGLRPSALKAVLRKEYFSTIDAMKSWAMNEPAVSRTLRKLSAEGWIAFDDMRAHVDNWTITDKGRRLAVTRLVKRFPISEGRATLAKIIEKARQLNAEPDSSRKITEIILFGSVLTAPDDADAGDIDLVVEVRRRKLSKDVLQNLEARERQRRPQSVRSPFNNDRSIEMARVIKSVSHRISVHERGDIDVLKPAHKAIYRYDVDSEVELPPGGLVPGEQPDALLGDQSETAKPAPPIERQEWPRALNAVVDADHTCLETLLDCQHFWVRGASLAEIAQRTGLAEDSCQNYLSALQSQPFRHSEKLHRSFRETVLDAGLPHSATARIYRVPGQSPLADAEVLDLEDNSHTRLAWVRRVARYDANFRGQTHLFPKLDRASFVAWQFASKLAATAPEIGFELSTLHFPGDLREEIAHGPFPKLDAFVAPMKALLEEQRGAAGAKLRRHNERIVVDFEAGNPIQRLAFHDYRWPFQGTRILKRQAPVLWQLLREFRKRHPWLTSRREHLKIFVEG